MKKKSKARLPRRSWTSGRGALVVIAGILMLSGLLRIGSGSGAAIALDLREKAEMAMSGSAGSKEENPIADVTPELLALLKETKERQEMLLAREAELEARAQALALVEMAVNEDLARLEQAEADLRATMAAADQAAEGDLGRLTAVYENMKPDQAAALFQLMEPSFAAGFLGRMRADSAAAIMAGLTPDLAYTISVVLAGRNAEVPREPVPGPRKMPSQ